MRATVAIATLILAASGTAGWAQPGPNYDGELTNSIPRAEYALDLQAGQIITLTAAGTAGLDTVLTLIGPDGRQVAVNDDVMMGDLSSRIIYAADRPGRYTAVVSGYADATGPFDLDVYYGANVGLSYQARTLSDAVVTLSRRQTEASFVVDLPAGEPFVASTIALGEGMDTTLRLVDAAGEVVAENDDRGDGTLNSQIVFQTAQGGRYTVVVSSFSGQDAGEAILSLAVDPNAQAPFDYASIERSPIARHEGEITDDQPEHDYVLDLTAGQTILVLADAGNDSLDPVLTLSGEDGYPVALNDDRGDGSLNSAIAYTAPAAGRYTLNIARYASGESTGPYTLEIANADASVVADIQAIYENPVRLSGPEEILDTTDFRLRYTLTGRDATTEAYARETADALQRAYDTQITQMGWAAPIRDTDGRYRAYIADAGDGTMGFMKGVEAVFDNPNTPNVRERASSRGLLVVDNDLSAGRDEAAESLMRATVGHEFNHLVQYGYDAEEGLNWLYESTASWIETVTMGEEEDAARYAVTDFAAPQLCWTTTAPGHNYGQWTLLQSLADSHGPRIVTRIWENASTLDGLETMTTTLGEVGTTIPEALRNWRIQNFARNYEMAPRIDGSVALAGAAKGRSASLSGTVQELGAAYHQVRARGAQRYTLDGNGTLEMTALGLRNGQVEVVPLGRDGVFDAAGYDFAAIMVFNADTPDSPGDCNDERYRIEASRSDGASNPVASRVDARHFRTPGS